MGAVIDKFVDMHVSRILRDLHSGIEQFNGFPGWGLDEEHIGLLVGLILEKALTQHDPEKHVFTNEELLSSIQEAGLVRVIEE
jgi:hypothetical protein